MMESKPYGYNLKDLNRNSKEIIGDEVYRLHIKGLVKNKTARALFKSK